VDQLVLLVLNSDRASESFVIEISMSLLKFSFVEKYNYSAAAACYSSSVVDISAMILGAAVLEFKYSK